MHATIAPTAFCCSPRNTDETCGDIDYLDPEGFHEFDRDFGRRLPPWVEATCLDIEHVRPVAHTITVAPDPEAAALGLVAFEVEYRGHRFLVHGVGSQWCVEARDRAGISGAEYHAALDLIGSGLFFAPTIDLAIDELAARVDAGLAALR